MSIVSRAAFFFASGSLAAFPAGLGGIFDRRLLLFQREQSLEMGLSDRVVCHCCCMVWYGAKDVCSLKIQAALYFDDQLVAVERLNFGNFLRSFTPITSAPLCYTSLLDAASVACRCPHFQHTLACRSDPELAGEQETRGAGSPCKPTERFPSD
jgi:hypothetical protein